MRSHEHYDLIFLGGGNFTFQLLGSLLEKDYRGRIAVIEQRDTPVQNHRWCTWWPADKTSPAGTTAVWDSYAFRHGEKWIQRPLRDWRYVHIDSGAFYHQHLAQWRDRKQIDFFWGQSAPNPVATENGSYLLPLNQTQLTSRRIVDTRYRTDLPPSTPFDEQTGWWQSFYGKVIPDYQASLPKGFGLMDFNLQEDDGFAFGYLLPLPGRKTLVEYTAFHRKAKSLAHMKAQLARYLGASDDEDDTENCEHGWLPMSADLTPVRDLPGYWYGGLRANGARPATGYAYFRNQQRVEQFAQAILREQILPDPPRISLSRWLDPVFLETLVDDPSLTRSSMVKLMQTLSGDEMASFLSDRPSPGTIAKVIFSLPKKPFLQGALSYATKHHHPVNQRAHASKGPPQAVKTFS